MTTTSYSFETARPDATSTVTFGERLTTFGEQATRYSVVLVLVWIGAMKFTGYEAAAIEGLVASSPLVGWLYGFLSLQATSNLIGIVEIAVAGAILFGPYNRLVAIAGALGAVATFTITLSFLFSAPGWESSLGGFPALSVVPGQFLLKDVVLLAVSVFLLGKAIARQR